MRRPEPLRPGAGPADARRHYPSQPSTRIAEAKSSKGRKGAPGRVPEKARDPSERAKRRTDERILCPCPVPSGAYTFPRNPGFKHEGVFQGVGADLIHPGSVPASEVQKRLEASGHDLPSGELPALANAFTASVTDCIRAGRFPLAGALSARLHQLDGRPETLHPAEMTPRAAATTRIIRAPCDLPQRLHSVPAATRPIMPLSLPWTACSRGARLACSRTTVVRDAEKSMTVDDSVLRGPEGVLGTSPAQPSQSLAADPTTAPMRLRQKWPQALAVGPASAIVSRFPEGRYFETSVELAAQAREHFQSRVHAAAGPGQRPLLHMGVTTAAPPDDVEEVLGLPYTSGDQCWLISTAGHVYSEGEHRCTTAVTWPQLTPRPSEILRVRPQSGSRLGLLITDAGELQLSVNGSVVATSPPDTLPRALAWSADMLFPMVVLGPNIWRVTLCSLSTEVA
mmetsp:Transcript_20084/g.47310  ORF Transcript_20084/g.47310 Transcript_20084/m.47310 type:complete len:454 (-) Transcript_20084:22-1383(-)